LAACVALIAPVGAGFATAATTSVGIVHAQPPYPPTAPGDSESSSTACAGCAVTTTWSGYAPGSTVTIEFFSTPVILGGATADANGTATFDATIPSGASPGEHKFVGTGVDPQGKPLTESLQILITGPSPVTGTPGASELAKTGTDLLAPAGLGAAALGVGALLFLAIRRRSVSNFMKR
jgi:titin